MQVCSLAVISESDRDWSERRHRLEATLIALAPSYPRRPFRCIRVAVDGGPAAYYYVPRARALLVHLPLW